MLTGKAATFDETDIHRRPHERLRNGDACRSRADDAKISFDICGRQTILVVDYHSRISLTHGYMPPSLLPPAAEVYASFPTGLYRPLARWFERSVVSRDSAEDVDARRLRRLPRGPLPR